MDSDSDHSPSQGAMKRYQHLKEQAATAARTDSSGSLDSSPDSPAAKANVVEVALWRAFDACIGLVCLHERARAKQVYGQHQLQVEATLNRCEAFKNLRREVPPSERPGGINEGRPGASPRKDLPTEPEKFDDPDAVDTASPYYLRYLPESELNYLHRLCSIIKFSYDLSLQSYAYESLKGYTEVLQNYYLSGGETAPALGFC